MGRQFLRLSVPTKLHQIKGLLEKERICSNSAYKGVQNSFLWPRHLKNGDRHYVLPLSIGLYVSVRPPMQLLQHLTDIHETYSQYLPKYVVVHKGLDLHLGIPTISYGALLFVHILNIKGKILVNATPPIPLDSHSSVLALVCCVLLLCCCLTSTVNS